VNGTAGSPGSDGDRPGGGGGGGSGGCILIQGCNVTIGPNAELNASGGAGGRSGDDTTGNAPDDEGGGGGGGGGGTIWIYADNAYSEAPAVFNVTGGAGGKGSYGASSTVTGTDGAAGSAGQIIKPIPGTPPNTRTTYTSPFTYAPAGYYASPVYDAGRIAFWENITITYDTHWAGTAVDVYYKVWNDTEPGWTYLATLSGGSSVSNATLPLPPSAFGRFMQYNLTLLTSFSTMPGWPYRCAVVIDNTANPNTLVNYTVKLTLDTASLIAQGKMRSDCGDIRFTDINGVEIPYWIESGINSANTSIWINVPEIEGSLRTLIFMYYGNLSATSKSNGSATFLFFDDFLGTSLDTGKWQVLSGGTISISNGEVVLTGDGTNRAKIVSNTFQSTDNCAIVAKGRVASANNSSALLILQHDKNFSSSYNRPSNHNSATVNNKHYGETGTGMPNFSIMILCLFDISVSFQVLPI